MMSANAQVGARPRDESTLPLPRRRILLPPDVERLVHRCNDLQRLAVQARQRSIDSWTHVQELMTAAQLLYSRR
jgi:hypothetical protein